MAMPQEEKAGRSVTGELSLNTERRTQLLDVTVGVMQTVKDSGVRSGVC